VPRYPWIPKYIEDTWPRKYSMLVVTAWTDHIPHFGNMAIPRAGHAIIKDAIRNSGGDLDKILCHISAILHRPLEEYRGELARQTASPPRKLLNLVYRLVLERVSYMRCLRPMKPSNIYVDCRRNTRRNIRIMSPSLWTHAPAHAPI
jgi:hypothetical protein